VSMDSTPALMDLLAEQLQEGERSPVTEWEAIAAAVLVPFYLDDGRWHLLYTRRTDSLNAHRGQVSFPGGAIEPGDRSPQSAALREANEEIGLRPESVQVLGRMRGLLTVSQYHVTPIVAHIPSPFEIRLNQSEVARAFGVPLDFLLEPGNVRTEERESVMLGGPVTVYYFRPYLDEVIWGVTARITIDLLDHVRAALQ
jgi:8-oxo-dGTP pyrophosphatase MutT (NUDIX family)